MNIKFKTDNLDQLLDTYCHLPLGQQSTVLGGRGTCQRAPVETDLKYIRAKSSTVTKRYADGTWNQCGRPTKQGTGDGT